MGWTDSVKSFFSKARSEASATLGEAGKKLGELGIFSKAGDVVTTLHEDVTDVASWVGHQVDKLTSIPSKALKTGGDVLTGAEKTIGGLSMPLAIGAALLAAVFLIKK